MSLWVLALTSSFAVSLGYGVRQKMTLLSRLETHAIQFPITETGVQKARGMLMAAGPVQTWDCLFDPWYNNKSAFASIELPEGTCRVTTEISDGHSDTKKTIYGIIDEERKININVSDAKTISRLIQKAASLSEGEADSLAYNIVDWRDSDSFYGHPNFGAEDKDYEDNNPPYEAKDSNYETIEELFLVKDITGKIFAKIAPYLTVYGEGAVNINTASEEALFALGFDEGLLDKIFQYRAGVDREEGTADDRVFREAQNIVSDLNGFVLLNPTEKIPLENAVDKEIVGVSSLHFRVHSVGLLKKEVPPMEIDAVVTKKGQIVSLRIL